MVTEPIAGDGANGSLIDQSKKIARADFRSRFIIAPQTILGRGVQMKKLLFVVVLFSPLLALAQSPFDGTWKIDLNKAQLPKKPDVYKLENGKFACDSCVPKYEVAADGQDQKVTGHPYFDTIAIKVVDDHNVETTYKRGDKTVLAEKYAISNDG